MISKRLKILCSGISILMLGTSAFAHPQPGAKQSRDEQKRLVEQCNKHNGQVWITGRMEEFRKDDGMIHFSCDVSELDEQCERERGENYYFSINQGRCVEDCFLTTACTELIGLPDDCFELRTLRRFRDNHLARMEGGQAEIDAYYRHAPAIVARIKASSSGRAELCRIYATVIAPSVISVMLGRYKTARAIYVGGMKRLMRTYAA